MYNLFRGTAGERDYILSPELTDELLLGTLNMLTTTLTLIIMLSSHCAIDYDTQEAIVITINDVC